MSRIPFKSFDLLRFGNEIEMTGVVYTDRPRGESYIIELPGESIFIPKEIEMEEGDWDVMLRQCDLLETEILAKAKDGSIVKAIFRKSNRQIDVQTTWKVFKRDNYTCRYCGKDGIPLTVDHILLWEKGGPSTEDNLVSACRKCNKTRGNTEYGEWLETSYYKTVSKKLSREVLQMNLDLVESIKIIPLKLHVASR